jgi:uncharacterized protein (TIGR00255 family)
MARVTSITSMTGSACVEASFGGSSWKWVLDSVNRPTLDVSFRPPNGYEDLKPICKHALEVRFARGTIVVKLNINTGDGSPAKLIVDKELLDTLVSMQDGYGNKIVKSSFCDLVRLSQTFATSFGTADVKALRKEMLKSFDVAADKLLYARDSEGAKIEKVMIEDFDRIIALVRKATDMPEGRPDAIRKRITDSLASYLDNADREKEQLLMQEAASVALDNANVQEEISRLNMHVDSLRTALIVKTDKRMVVGSQLDSLAKELEREANAFGAKAKVGGLINIGINLRIIIKNFREQSANVQ